MKKVTNEQLSALAKITTGLTNSAYSKEAIEGANKHQLLLGTSVKSDGSLNESKLIEVWGQPGKDLTRFLLQEGDVVLLAKGSSFKAGYINKKYAGMSILASANFIIIRLDTEKLHGEVLTAYLNSEIGQLALKSIQKGAVIQSITASGLRGLAVPVPSKTSQVSIVDLFQTGREAYNATIALAEQQKKAVEAKIINLMEEAA